MTIRIRTWFGLHLLVFDHVEYLVSMLCSVFAAEDSDQKCEERQLVCRLYRVQEDVLKHFERGESSRLFILAISCYQRTRLDLIWL